MSRSQEEHLIERVAEDWARFDQEAIEIGDIVEVRWAEQNAYAAGKQEFVGVLKEMDPESGFYKVSMPNGAAVYSSIHAWGTSIGKPGKKNPFVEKAKAKKPNPFVEKAKKKNLFIQKGKK